MLGCRIFCNFVCGLLSGPVLFNIFIMKKSLFAGIFGLAALCAGATDLFFYSPEDGNGGLRFAVSDDGKNWRSIGNGFDFVRSDFGSWGSGKKMWSPQLFPDRKSTRLNSSHS